LSDLDSDPTTNKLSLFRCLT